MPRMALGYCVPGVAVLRGVGLEVARRPKSPGPTWSRARGDLAPERPSAENEAKQLALASATASGVYGAGHGRRRLSLEDRRRGDAKVFALSGAVREMNHTP